MCPYVVMAIDIIGLGLIPWQAEFPSESNESNESKFSFEVP